MVAIKQLAKEDIMFVAGETDTIYQHAAGLMLLDPAGKPDFDFAWFRKKCIERISQIPHFHWKLHSVPMGMDRPYWVEDGKFNYSHHIKRIAVPQPGDAQALSEVVAHLYSTHLDRTKPLWEIWLIEGLEGGKFAYLQKFHHCMMDGQGAFKLVEIMCDFEPEPVLEKKVDEAISNAKAGRVPTYAERSTQAWIHLARLPGDAARGIYDAMRPMIADQFAWPKKPKKDKLIVPNACFNGELSSERALVFGSLPLADVKAIKNHFAVSVNDVILALVSSAIRSYLQHHAELPNESLRSGIPVSLRTEGDDDFSNKVTTMTVTLATDIEDPVERLKAINAESTLAKQEARGGVLGITEIFQMLPPALVHSMMESLPVDQAPQMMGANLIVSNVQGSPVPMYIAGVKIEGMYPMSILTAAMGINFTCVSYMDKIDFGITVEPDMVPERWSILDELAVALAEYTALITAKPASAGKKVGRKKPVAKKKASSKKTTAKRKSAAIKPAAAKKRAVTRKKTAAAKASR